MKLDLNDVIEVQSEMLNALRDYAAVLKMPNCNSCVKGLDICPAEGAPLRINCPAYWDASKGDRPGTAPKVENDILGEAIDAGVCEPADGPNEPVTNDDEWDAMNKPVIDEEIKATCPDDPKLLNYLRHNGSEA